MRGLVHACSQRQGQKGEVSDGRPNVDDERTLLHVTSFRVISFSVTSFNVTSFSVISFSERAHAHVQDAAVGVRHGEHSVKTRAKTVQVVPSMR
jgi:hypothetical protein